MLFHKMFTKKGRDEIKERVQEWKANAKAWNFLSNGIDLADYSSNLRQEIKDPHLLAAIEFIKKVAREENYGTDLHADNIMVRRTSVGPQIVINDPLGFSQAPEFPIDIWPQMLYNTAWNTKSGT